MAQAIITATRITREIEFDLAARIHAGDEAAVWELAELAMPLVIRTARRYDAFGVDLEDLISEGRIGAMTAAAKFNPTMGVFFAHARKYITSAVSRYVADKYAPVVIPDDVFQHRAGSEHLRAVADQYSYAVSFQDPVNIRRVGSVEVVYLGDVVADPRVDPDAVDCRLTVHEAVAQLTPTQRRLISLTFLDDDLTGNEAAAVLGVTKSAISTQRKRAMSALVELLA